MARFGSAAHSGSLARRTTLTPPSSSALAVPSSRALRMTSLEAKITIARSPFPRPKRRTISTPERMALRRLLRADIAAADLVDRRRHRHVLVHHLDAGLGGLLGERKDRRLAGMAHHRDAVGMRGDRLAQLLRHLLVRPSRRRRSRPARRCRPPPGARRCRRSCRRRRPRRRRRRSAGGPCCTICRATLRRRRAPAAPTRAAQARASATDPRQLAIKSATSFSSSQIPSRLPPLVNCRPLNCGRRSLQRKICSASRTIGNTARSPPRHCLRYSSARTWPVISRLSR